MTYEEQRRYLLQALLAEDPQYQGMTIPPDEMGQERLLRALMNVRPPKPIGKDFLEIQDAYLAWVRDRRGVIDGDSLPASRQDPRLVLWQGDITTLKVDAIVNAANSGLLGCFQPLHGCIDNIIHTRAGVQLRLRCSGLMRQQGREEPTGRAKLTSGYNLPAQYILHTVGPIVNGSVTRRDQALLASCYRSCLSLAAAHGLHSVAFCCISTGVFHFPNEKAAEIAVAAVKEFLKQPSSLQRVIFDVFKDEDREIYQALLGG